MRYRNIAMQHDMPPLFNEPSNDVPFSLWLSFFSPRTPVCVPVQLPQCFEMLFDFIPQSRTRLNSWLPQIACTLFYQMHSLTHSTYTYGMCFTILELRTWALVCPANRLAEVHVAPCGWVARGVCRPLQQAHLRGGQRVPCCPRLHPLSIFNFPDFFLPQIVSVSVREKGERKFEIVP